MLCFVAAGFDEAIDYVAALNQLKQGRGLGDVTYTPNVRIDSGAKTRHACFDSIITIQLSFNIQTN